MNKYNFSVMNNLLKSYPLLFYLNLGTIDEGAGRSSQRQLALQSILMPDCYGFSDSNVIAVFMCILVTNITVCLYVWQRIKPYLHILIIQIVLSTQFGNVLHRPTNLFENTDTIWSAVAFPPEAKPPLMLACLPFLIHRPVGLLFLPSYFVSNCNE